MNTLSENYDFKVMGSWPDKKSIFVGRRIYDILTTNDGIVNFLFRNISYFKTAIKIGENRYCINQSMYNKIDKIFTQKIILTGN